MKLKMEILCTRQSHDKFMEPRKSAADKGVISA
jgi:hypothetical protein